MTRGRTVPVLVALTVVALVLAFGRPVLLAIGTVLAMTGTGP